MSQKSTQSGSVANEFFNPAGSAVLATESKSPRELFHLRTPWARVMRMRAEPRPLRQYSISFDTHSDAAAPCEAITMMYSDSSSACATEGHSCGVADKLLA